MKRWKRLVDNLPASPIMKYLLIIVALAMVAVLGVALVDLSRSPMGPNWPSSPISPTPTLSGSAQQSPRPTVVPTATSSSEPRVDPISSRVPTSRPFVVEDERYLPLVFKAVPPATRTARPTKAPPTPTPTPTPVDFAAVREQLQAEGKDLAYVKIGFHTAPGGNTRGLGEYLEGLAQAGVPAVMKSADAYGVCVEALRASPDNVTVFRMSGGDLELPDYDLPAETAAEEHWRRILEALPPEFDQRTWIEVMNEPDKERADWLGRFAYRIAELALRDGYRFAAFGWSSGEPEPEHWKTPGMQAFLSLAAQHPERLAVALHEYSYSVDSIANQYPSLVGRFQLLFRACDELGVERPTVLITEWGWEAEKVPPVSQAMEDIAWTSQLYGAYPQVKGAALWYLGSGYGGIANQAQQLILPLRYYAWSEYFVIEPGQKPTDPNQFRPE